MIQASRSYDSDPRVNTGLAYVRKHKGHRYSFSCHKRIPRPKLPDRERDAESIAGSLTSTWPEKELPDPRQQQLKPPGQSQAPARSYPVRMSYIDAWRNRNRFRGVREIISTSSGLQAMLEGLITRSTGWNRHPLCEDRLFVLPRLQGTATR